MSLLEKLVDAYRGSFLRVQNAIEREVSDFYHIKLRGQHKHKYVLVDSGVDWKQYECKDKNCGKLKCVYEDENGVPQEFSSYELYESEGFRAYRKVVRK